MHQTDNENKFATENTNKGILHTVEKIACILLQGLYQSCLNLQQNPNELWQAKGNRLKLIPRSCQLICVLANIRLTYRRLSVELLEDGANKSMQISQSPVHWNIRRLHHG